MGRSWLGILAACALLAPAAPRAEESSAAATVRDLVAAPDRYANRAVRVTGRFRGRAADGTGASARPPGGSRWDFLLASEDAAVWVTGKRPVGRDFDLDPRSPADASSGRWLDVIGTVRVSKRRTSDACAAGPPCRHVWIEASDLHLAIPPGSVASGARARPSVPLPRVVFNDPIHDEAGVSPETTVRLQFSQHVAPETLSGRLRVSYASPVSLASAPVPGFSATYQASTRSIEVRFATPLAGSRTVSVELLPGVRALDGRPLEPWELTFTTAAPDVGLSAIDQHRHP